jgi:predicted  nucleic acid-binding Zn-ribbon protein
VSADPTDDDTSTVDAADRGEPSSAADWLLRLRDLDADVDRIRREETSDPTVAALRAAQAQRAGWERRDVELQAELELLAEQVDKDEQEDALLHSQLDRLRAQLRTVIAPREAEALMHEIETVEARRSALDDDELAALERQVALDDELVAHRASESVVSSAIDAAEVEGRRAAARHQAASARLGEQVVAARSRIPSAALESYDRHRAQFGVGAARLVGHRCESCHLDLSAGEVDQLRADAGADGFAECPCGRLLLVVGH